MPRSRFAEISSTFVCIPCSLSLNNSVVTELRGEIAALKADIVELRTALDSANKKLETVGPQGPNPATLGEAGAEWTAVVKKNAKQRRRDHNPTSKPSSRLSPRQPNPPSPSGHPANARPPISEDNQAAKVRVSGARRVWGTHWSCTPKAVNSAITKFCGVTPKENVLRMQLVRQLSGGFSFTIQKKC